jgi:hypothetical protein
MEKRPEEEQPPADESEPTDEELKDYNDLETGDDEP